MQLFLENGRYIITTEGIDCSLTLTNDENNPRAWYVGPPSIEPVRTNGWVGAVAEGGSVNFRDITFNPHGHGTHTECLGHITKEVNSVNGLIEELFYDTIVITIEPEVIFAEDGLVDRVVNLKSVGNRLEGKKAKALMIRTLPNDAGKRHVNYSDSNPAYLSTDLIPLINELGVVHLLVDLPSVDREKDGGNLAFHHAFWDVPNNPNTERTITELIFVPDEVEDGGYLLNLQTAPFENDATPSRPIIYPLHQNAED
jgi:kynurenine formamidase